MPLFKEGGQKMKCEKCGNDFSPKVHQIHVRTCKSVKGKIDTMTFTELRKLAAKINLNVGKNPNKDLLIDRLKEVL